MTREAVSLPPISKRQNRSRLEKSPTSARIGSWSRTEIFGPFQKIAFCGQGLFTLSKWLRLERDADHSSRTPACAPRRFDLD